MEREELKPGQIYQHFKGKLYQILTVAIHSETEELLVIYKPLYGSQRTYARPLEMFMSEVDHEKYPDVEAKYRFTLVGEGKASEDAKADHETTGENNPKEDSACGENSDLRNSIDSKENSDTREEIGSEEEELHLDPMLEKFLDADSFEEKLEIFCGMRNRITYDIVQTIAMSLDLELNSTDPERCYDDVKNCLTMMEKYECNRLR